MRKFLIGILCMGIAVCMIACEKSAEEDDGNAGEDKQMRLYLNESEVPVLWENNASVSELMREADRGDIVVSMSMYGGFEQVGALGKKYSSQDKQTETHCGDIVLYNSSNLVVFYGSNSWSYTRLGSIDLSEAEIIELLCHKDVTARISVRR